MRKLIILFIAVLFLNSHNYKIKNAGDVLRFNTECRTTEITAVTTQESTEPLHATAEILTECHADMCELLEEKLENSEYTANDLDKSEQLITVTSSGTFCEVNFFEKINTSWENTYHTKGIVGKNGVSSEYSEKSCCTPKGLFSLGFAFGSEPVSGLSIEYRQYNENCYWVDDSESEFYNQWVESDDIKWNSAEHLSDYPVEYKYAIVINSNPLCIPYGGSAIFLHCTDFSYNYTLGCVAVSEHDMYNILCMLDESKNPVILIE